MQRNRLWLRLSGAMAFLLVLLACYWLASETDVLDTLLDPEALRSTIDDLGLWGPLGVIALMTLAIVFSPIPSGPIALAAGAAFGRQWGTLYVVVGAEAGAILAFAIARLLGRAALSRWLGDRLPRTAAVGQNALMAIVFLSRLVPFISFDMVSYAAGLTPLAFWRFAVATLAGVVPISIVFTHFGAEMVTAEADRILVVVLALGFLTIGSLLVKVVLDRRRSRRDAD